MCAMCACVGVHTSCLSPLLNFQVLCEEGRCTSSPSAQILSWRHLREIGYWTGWNLLVSQYFAWHPEARERRRLRALLVPMSKETQLSHKVLRLCAGCRKRRSRVEGNVWSRMNTGGVLHVLATAPCLFSIISYCAWVLHYP